MEKRIVPWRGITSGIAISLLILALPSCSKVDETDKGSVTDIEGTVYNTVKIDNLWWMAENLKTTKLNDGTSLSMISDNSSWGALRTPAYCWYNNNTSNKNIYGALYNWYVVTTNKICPAGWRVPSKDEWQTLVTFLGGEAIAGGKMKAKGTDYWEYPNVNATDEVGFSARPGGFRYYNEGWFDEENQRGWWWSSTDGEAYFASAFIAIIRNDSESILIAEANERNGVYIRCVKGN
jgi:uncharacterized protein (TIGR02145 family)